MKPDPRRSLRRQVVTLGAVLAALAAASPARAGRAPSVRDTTYRLVSEFGPDTLLIRELEFEGPMLSAAIDASRGVVVVAVPGTWANQLMAYDLEARRVIWEKSENLLPFVAGADRAVLRQGTRTELVRVSDGKELGSLHGAPFMWEDGVALRVTSDEIGRVDLGSGHDLWRVDRGIRGAVDALIRRDSVAYLVADGIQKIDIRSGLGWSYSIQASRKGLYSAPGGGTEQVRSLYGGSRATNLTAEPLIEGADVYFAAETTVVKLDSGSGATRWRQELRRAHNFSLMQRALGMPSTQEFLGHLVLQDAGSNIAVASLGWANGTKSLLSADPPTLALLAKSDGHVVARFQVPRTTYLNDLWCTPAGCYLVAPDRVLLMDDSLNIRATFQASGMFQPLGQFIDARGAIVLAAGAGMVALSPDSLKLVWSLRCGRLLTIEPETNAFRTRYAVTTLGLLRLDKGEESRPNAYYPLRGTWAELRGGWLLQGAGTRLRAVTLVERGPAPRVD